MRDGQAEVREGGIGTAALTIGVPLIEFIRVITEGGSFLPLISDGTMTLEGDLGLAGRMAEMFGARSAY